MNVVIDRFEGDFAVCEKGDRTMVNIKRSLLPSLAKEGDVLLIRGNIVIIDQAETAKRRAEANRLMKDLWQENPK